MNPHQTKNSGLTLMELLLALSLLGIIMMGVTSMDLSLRRLSRATTSNAVVAARTSAIMLDIAKNIQLATGDSTNVGIRIVPNDRLCVRQNNPVISPPTPNNYNDDIYVCFQEFVSGNIRDIRRCSGPVDLPPNNWYDSGVCGGGNLRIGSFYSISYALTSVPATQTAYLDVAIVNRFNVDTTQSAHIFTNPEYRLKSRIALMSSSM